MAHNIPLLGAIAGLTIFLGLPVGRTRHLSLSWRALLNASAIGVLLFLLYDVLSHAVDPMNAALDLAEGGRGSWAHFAWLAALGAGGLTLGAVGLVYYERFISARAQRLPPSWGAGAASVAQFRPGFVQGLAPPRRLALFIALGIGLHNFSEGLAIGQSAGRGAISLAVVLVIGFGLHNATEGFGIVAPMAAEEERPSWAFLALLGLIGGAPTFVGTLVGRVWVNDMLFLGFLALAAGSIIYVVVQLLHVAAKLAHRELLMWGIVLGLLAGFATDFVLTAAGV